MILKKIHTDIVEYLTEHPHAVFREMMQTLDIKSTSQIHRYLRTLERAGYVKKNKFSRHWLILKDQNGNKKSGMSDVEKCLLINEMNEDMHKIEKLLKMMKKNLAKL